MALLPALLIWFAATAGCSGKESEDACTPVRAPTGSVVTGDSNADGAVDLADVVGYRDHLFAGGAAPSCPAAAEVLGFEAEAANLWTTLSYAFAGTAIVDGKVDCAPASQAKDVCAGTLELVPTENGIELKGLAKGDAVQAWSFGVETEGCTITAATTAGTVGALEIDGGHRRGGYERTELKDGHAVTAVLLDGFAPRGLPKGDSTLLAIDYGEPCSACTVRVVDGLVGGGRAVPAVVVIDGKAVVPTLGEARFDHCP